MISLGRPPIESPEPVVKFAAVRLLLALAVLVVLATTQFHHHAQLRLSCSGWRLPWAVAMLYVANRWPEIALQPFVPVVDLAVIALAELAVPQAYAPARFVALFFVAAHAQFQGQRGGLMVAATACVLLVPITALTSGPVQGELLAFYEALFVVCVFSAAITAGNIRTSETAGRLRARERQPADDRGRGRDPPPRGGVASTTGPIQELVGLDMMLAALPGAIERGDQEQTRELIREVRDHRRAQHPGAPRRDRRPRPLCVPRSCRSRPPSRSCVPVWQRRYGVRRPDRRSSRSSCSPRWRATCSGSPRRRWRTPVATPRPTTCGWRWRSATACSSCGSRTTARGFGDFTPAMTEASGHIGLASMRERAELIHGKL